MSTRILYLTALGLIGLAGCTVTTPSVTLGTPQAPPQASPPVIIQQPSPPAVVVQPARP